MKKDKWIATFLNILPGAGYIYLGTRKPFALLLLSILPFMVIASMTWPEWSSSSEATTMTLPDFGLTALILGAFMTDAYYEAEAVNKKMKKKQ